MKYLSMTIALCMLSLVTTVYGQNAPEVQDSVEIPEITIIGRDSKRDIQQMPEIVGTNIYAGKKSCLVVMDNVQGNAVTNTMRRHTDRYFSPRPQPQS